MLEKQVRQELERILSSKTFSESERHRRFLKFIVDRTLQQRVDEIKESTIALEALGRSCSFDPKTDPIVRVEAGRLRARLSSFYESEAEPGIVRIVLPKGGYIPTFVATDAVLPKPRAPVLSAIPIAGALLIVVFATLLWPRHRSEGEVRLSMLAPENAVVESLAMSPDGKWIAFTAGSNGRPMLWLRELKSTESRLLPGTESASNPFWSPDGRSLGFFTPSQLKRVDLSGGPVQVLYDCGLSYGGTWSRRGIILFSALRDNATVLYEIAERGGVPKRVTALDESRAEYAHRYPQFLPDGRHFLYFAASRKRRAAVLRAGALDSRETRVLVPAEAGPYYAPTSGGGPGLLLFVSGGKLLKQRFNPDTLELSDSASEAIAEVRYSATGQLHFSASDNGFWAYQCGSPNDHQLAWFTREGKLIEEVGTPNSWASFQLSPDERWVTFQQEDPETGEPSVWLMELTTRSISKLTAPALSGRFPIWSPDGSRIAYAGPKAVLSQPVDRRDAVVLGEGPGVKFPTDWSSDGRWILYHTAWPDPTRLSIWALDANNQLRQQVRPVVNSENGSTVGAYFAPSHLSNRWIAYTTDEVSYGKLEVWVGSFPDVTSRWQISNDGGWLPHWRIDGTELFYLKEDGTLMAVQVRLGQTFSHGAPQPLFRTGLRRDPRRPSPNVYAASRDGRFLINRRLVNPASAGITVVVPTRL